MVRSLKDHVFLLPGIFVQAPAAGASFDDGLFQAGFLCCLFPLFLVHQGRPGALLLSHPAVLLPPHKENHRACWRRFQAGSTLDE